MLGKAEASFLPQSYAGVYIPMLAELVHLRGLPIRFLGFATGDPCTDERYQHLDEQLHFNLQFALSRGFVSRSVYETITSRCLKRKEGTGHLIPDYRGVGCRSAWRLFFIATSSDDGYTDKAAKLPHGGFIDPYTTYGPNGHDFDKAMREYLNWSPVRDALHADGMSWGRLLRYTKQFSACFYEEETDPRSKPQYNTSMLPIYRRLAGKVRTIMVFNGDTDPDVQFQGTEDAVAAIGLPVALGGEWRPWFYRQGPAPLELLRDKPPFWGAPLSHHPLPGAQLAGYVTDYAANVSFATVHGSGHMVPMFQPEVALHFFRRVLSGKPLSPRLDMSILENDTDKEFFGKGYLRQWIKDAQSLEYSGCSPVERQVQADIFEANGGRVLEVE